MEVIVKTRMWQQVFAVLILFGALAGACGAAKANSLATVVDCCTNVPSSGTQTFTSPANGLPSTVTWDGTGHINGPTDIGASMTASFTNYAAGTPESHYFFAEEANFSDIVTVTGSTAPVFNFTLSGTTSASNIDYAAVAVQLWFTGCLTTLCGSGGEFDGPNGDFSFSSSNTYFGPGRYQLYIRLEPRVCFVNCTSFIPATGSNLSGTSDYNDTLTLDSVTLAPGGTMIGQSGVNYTNLNASPEPGSMGLLFAGFAAVWRLRRRVG